MKDGHGSVLDPENLVTRLLVEFRDGDRAALDRLLPIVYEELRRIAHRQRRRQPDGETLSTTALVHESYFKLARGAAVEWSGRVHFFAVAARAMRQVLVDHATRHATAKRGGSWSRVALDEASLPVETQSELVLELDAALTRLAELEPRWSRQVECRFFGGMTEEETAEALGVSARTLRRDWLKARLWLHAELAAQDPS